MNCRKLLALTLSVLAVLPLLASCGRIRRIRNNTPSILTYTNADYHFSLTYPSGFDEIKEIPSEENGDEYRIELRRDDGRMISVDIEYKKADQIGVFAELYCTDKQHVIPLSGNSFAYDKRDCLPYEKPTYYIYASTKRMLYTVKYEYERGDRDGDDVVSAMSFEFDIYANVYKNNAFLLPEVSIADGRASVKLPGNMSTLFYPDPAGAKPMRSYDDEGVLYLNTDYKKYSSLVSISNESLIAVSLPYSSKYSPADLSTDRIESEMDSLVSEITTDKLSQLKKIGEAEQRTNSVMQYRIINFSCMYNGKKASGSLTVGYTTLGRYFEYVYAISDDASDPAIRNYLDMIDSVNIF